MLEGIHTKNNMAHIVPVNDKLISLFPQRMLLSKDIAKLKIYSFIFKATHKP